MLQYILECIAFQLVFLIIFDLFLKRETFFQGNRLYLIGSYILSMILPWIKIEAMKNSVPEAFQAYPEFLWNMNDALVPVNTEEKIAFSISWEYSILFGGMFLASLFFGYKLHQIYALKKKGEVHYFKDFTQITIANSSLAFSFFKSIFLGDKVISKEHKSIVQHELVHIRQKHSYDLMFFELMRILGWFNPLVYVYQSRVSELHEFIADAQVAKSDKKAQYEFLLSQVFQTQNISFINQFFKSSLIKKRIVMLTKEKSKQVWQLKYAVLIPVVFSILCYTSCELERNVTQKSSELIEVTDVVNLSQKEKSKVNTALKKVNDKADDFVVIIKDSNTELTFTKAKDGSYIEGLFGGKMPVKIHVESKLNITAADILGKNYLDNSHVPFSVVEEVPIFPGCEDDSDPRACFNKMMQKHIGKNFRYPQKAQELGIQGRVNAIFVIAEDGSIQNLKMRGPDSLLENEVKRIIERLPKMLPGKQDGKAVRVPFSIPITFKLEQSSSNKFYDKKGVEESEAKFQNLFDGAYGDIISFSKVDVAPTFPDCKDNSDIRACFQKSIQRHISKNFRYPEEAQQKEIQGRVAVLFIISKDGTIKGLKTKGPDKLLEDEAKRIVALLPKMIPGSHNEKLTDVTFSIPITFKLQ